MPGPPSRFARRGDRCDNACDARPLSSAAVALCPQGPPRAGRKAACRSSCRWRSCGNGGRNTWRLNPAGTVPTLVEDNGLVIPDSGGDLRIPGRGLSRHHPAGPHPGRAGRGPPPGGLVRWQVRCRGDAEFVWRKIHAPADRRGNADPAAIRTGYIALRYHLDYLGWLAETRKWLAGSGLVAGRFRRGGASVVAGLYRRRRLAAVRPPRTGTRGSSRGRASAACWPTGCRGSRRRRITPISISEFGVRPLANRTGTSESWWDQAQNATIRRTRLSCLARERRADGGHVVEVQRGDHVGIGWSER